MAINIQPTNTGLISPKQHIISAVNSLISGKDENEINKISTGTLHQLSAEEIIAENRAKNNAPTILQVDEGELINNYFSQTRDNVTYNVNGVVFTNEEMKNSKEVIKNAISMLPTKGSDLDYSDYASMGIAGNMVSTYVKENLTEEQADILNKTIADYMESLISAEAENQTNMGYVTDSDRNKYYQTSGTLSGEAIASLKKEIAKVNMSGSNCNTLLANLEAAGKGGGLTASASNKGLAGSIKELFANANLNGQDDISEVLEKYRMLIMPAYEEWGLSDNRYDKSLTHAISNDISRFSMQFSIGKSVISNVGAAGMNMDLKA